MGMRLPRPMLLRPGAILAGLVCRRDPTHNQGGKRRQVKKGEGTGDPTIDHTRHLGRVDPPAGYSAGRLYVAGLEGTF